jgi:hypothetical protein
MPTARSQIVRRLPHRGTLALAGLLAIAALVAGCNLSSSSPTTALTENQQTLTTCDRAHPPATWVAIDGATFSASSAIFNERMTALESIARQTAVCSGYLKVIAFGGSSVQTATLYDGFLRQAGATDNARLLRVPAAVANVMATVRKAYGPAVAHWDHCVSDVTSQYRLASEWFGQLGGSYGLHVYLLTDGIQNARVVTGTEVLDPAQAAALAQQVPVPNLAGAEIVVAGLGITVRPLEQSDVVESLVSYYTDVCRRTSARKCVAVSSYQESGW